MGDLTEPVRLAAAHDEGAEGEELTPTQVLFVECLIQGMSISECAEKVERSERSLQYWRKMPKVRAALRDAYDVGLARARAHLSNRAMDVAQALTKMGTGEADADPAGVSACRASLEMAIKLGEYAGDAAPTKHEISGTAPISLRIVDPLDETKPEQENADASGGTGTGGDS